MHSYLSFLKLFSLEKCKHSVGRYIFKKIPLYLAVLGLSCSTWDLLSSLHDAGPSSCSIRDLIHRPGMEPGLPTLGSES